MRVRAGTTALVVLVLSACAGAPPRPDLSAAERAAAEAAQVEREARLRAAEHWSLSGRVAVSNQGKGGSGRIEWRQSGPEFLVSLSAPVTRQGWQLQGRPGHAVLEGVPEGPRHGSDARLLLLEATGWDIPVVALAEWIRGARAAALGPARIDYGSEGLPWRIRQAGWTIEFRWPTESAGSVGVLLPERLDASNGEARVKLVVDGWGGGDAATVR